MNETLEKPIQFLKGVGPRRAAFFEKLGVSTVEDLLHHYPRLWQDRYETAALNELTPNALVVLKGRVIKAQQHRAGMQLAIYKASLATSQGKVECVWFKHLSRRFDVFSVLKKEVVAGADIWVVGHLDPNLTGIQIRVDEHYLLSSERWQTHVGRLTPIYALTEGLNQKFLRELIQTTLASYADSVIDCVPSSLMSKRHLLASSQALKGLHFPQSEAEREAARERLAYEELLLLELAWILKRRQTHGIKKGFNYDIHRHLLSPFRNNLGFELTSAQKRVINEIFEDLRKPYPMTRLLQGDVGSGKTVVALSALLLTVENGAQAVLMAPTEILAEQHRVTVEKFLKNLPVKVAVLTSRVSKKEREKIIAAISEGQVDIVIGTHAILEEDVKFKNLRLAVIDEQHRFGVRQRTTLRQKGAIIDLLIMTATPIPRTLALALYGDLEVSTIDEMPPGRTPITTQLAQQAEALKIVEREVRQGRQAYIVYPIIEESARLDLQSAKKEFEKLSQEIFPTFKVALIHGAMRGAAKTKIMDDFSKGRCQILVATQVIEVGIDVPNATVMVIQNAERFGLASLHQLRGRIGRGSEKSHCLLVAEPKSEEAVSRLNTMTKTSDGFRIGEEDLKLRGPGELLGTAQSGELALQVADLFKDVELLTFARVDANELLTQDPKLLLQGHALLRRRLISLYQNRWNWIDLA